MAAVEQPHAESAVGPGRVVNLHDGSAVTIRRIEPADAYPLLRMFDRLSPESIYHRFFSPMPRPCRAALLHLAGLDHELHEALVAASGPGDRRRGALRRPAGRGRRRSRRNR